VLALGEVEILDLARLEFFQEVHIYLLDLGVLSVDIERKYGPYETLLIIVLDINDTLFIFDELGCFKIR